MFLTQIAQNISPGPAKYSQRALIGKACQTFTQSTIDPSNLASISSKLVGPGAYDTISAAEKVSLK